MRVKHFVAKNLKEAISIVKTDMGKDAVILHARKFKEGGFLGFFARDMVEITAAIEDVVLPVAKKETSITQKADLRSIENDRLPSSNVSSLNHKREESLVTTAQLVLNNNRIDGGITPGRDSVLLESVNQPDIKYSGNLRELSLVQDEIKDMKQMMTQVLKEVGRSNGQANFQPALARLFSHLRNRGIEERLANRLVRRIADSLAPDELEDRQKIQECLEDSVLDLFTVPQPIQLNQGNKPQVIFLVGPTGVGKTTTIAKLAAHFSLIEKRRLALITIDTYRIAAIEQLKTYGKIIGLPVEVVFTPEALRHSIELHGDKELILIDTAGRSPRNKTQMEELKAFLSQDQSYESCLVLSAGTRYQDMLKIYDSFSVVPLHRLVFTKLDETEVLGSILSLIGHTQKNLSYVTFGQNVPDDIEVVNPRRLAKLIVGQLGENRS
jgi:flagellar biosynthesis protein FlhF